MALSENLSIGQIAPDFSGKSLQGEVGFHEWLNNSWGVLMFYPVLKKPYEYRALYIVDPDKVLQMISLDPFSMGHDMDEVLRVLDSLRLSRMSKYAVSI